MKKLHTIDRVFIICNEEKENHRFQKWQEWTFERDDVEFFSYKWADELPDEDVKYWGAADPAIIAKESQFRTFPINNAEFSCSLNWIKLLEKIQQEGYERVLIFESDAYFDEYFEDDFNRAMKLVSAAQDLDLLSIGTGAGGRASINHNMYIPGIYKVKGVRALEGVVITKNGVNKILDYVHKNKLTMVFDIELKYAIEKDLVCMYWLEPPIVRQTSAEGLSESYLNQGQFKLLNNGSYGQK
jgi:GR25 family glycosyltransferase involved in LPS biosynthesis